MLYIGIDPGKAGGIAALDHTGQIREVAAMPATDAEVFALLATMRGRAMIERVHSSPQMGVVSAFTFGRGLGALHMALTAAAIPFDEVTPVRWQTAMQCRTKGDKNVSKTRAAQLFPSVRVTHAIADALLLAEYARRFHCGILPHLKGRSRDGQEERSRQDHWPPDTAQARVEAGRPVLIEQGAPLPHAARHGAGARRRARPRL